MQLIKGVEKAFFGLLLAADELNVVNQQDIHIPVFVVEGFILPLVKSGDELVGKPLGADIEHLIVFRQGGMPDGVQQMGLA